MARQQQTEPQGEDLPDISGPELSFCRLIVEKGLNDVGDQLHVDITIE